ncbi:MAG: hypothetical protein PHH85_09080 [Candidatus Methanoperedens sp.]|nr:hypothetical protein [Candidatus Methanoperedens sp.]
MASRIFLGNLFPEQDDIIEFKYSLSKTEDYDHPWLVIIAKGNIIEGVKART